MPLNHYDASAVLVFQLFLMFPASTCLPPLSRAGIGSCEKVYISH